MLMLPSNTQAVGGKLWNCAHHPGCRFPNP
jgi:hypothetical protein